VLQRTLATKEGLLGTIVEIESHELAPVFTGSHVRETITEHDRAGLDPVQAPYLASL
jgi:hypothetical protein